MNASNIHNFGNFMAYAAIGAAAGAAGGGLGAWVGASSPFWGTVAGGFTGGFVAGAGNAGYAGASLGQALKSGLISGGIAAGTAAVLYGAVKVVEGMASSTEKASAATVEAAGVETPVGEQNIGKTAASLDTDVATLAIENQSQIAPKDSLSNKLLDAYLNNNLSKNGYVEIGGNIGIGKYGFTGSIKISSRGVFLSWGLAPGSGAGFSATYNVGGMPSVGTTFSASASGGDIVGFRYRVIYGKNGQSVSVGSGVGLGYGQNIGVTNTIEIYPELKVSGN